MLGSPYEIQIPMTDTLVLTDPDVSVVIGTSGLSGGKNLTLPKVSKMDGRDIHLINLAGSGGTITVLAASGDAIVGRVTALVATGLILKNDGLKTWYGF